jgi:mannose-6-phosphate isomerase-like protein (cupin superfamily)
MTDPAATPGYEILSLDELEAYPSDNHGTSLLMPLRQRLGLQAFGANCWTAGVGEQVVPEHIEDSGDEELYVVVRGRARFLVEGETLDAPVGTLVYVQAGELRQAFVEEEGTIVLAVGGTPGKAFGPRGWDDVVVAFGEGRSGRVEEGRAKMRAIAAGDPEAWYVEYNLACYEARFGDVDAAFEHLRVARERNPEEVAGFLERDTDLDRLRGDARWKELAG